ncbi:MAG: sigma-70 family RNA polymerase sigma factor [Planctomycetes bacterium]|nr:sigma-70 family RNA polymerase sigma factor [Planctomycetota bacterium]
MDRDEPNNEDRALLDRVRQGDLDAIDEALRRIDPLTEERARRAVGPRLEAWANVSDIRQDAFLVVLRSCGSFRGETMGSFGAWVRQIIDHTAQRAVRHKEAGKRKPPSRPSGLEALAAQIARPVATPSTPAREAEELARYHAAIESLSPAQRMVVEHVLLEQRPVSELSESTGQSVHAIHSLLSRARAALAIKLRHRSE